MFHSLAFSLAVKAVKNSAHCMAFSLDSAESCEQFQSLAFSARTTRTAVAAVQRWHLSSIMRCSPSLISPVMAATTLQTHFSSDTQFGDRDRHGAGGGRRGALCVCVGGGGGRGEAGGVRREQESRRVWGEVGCILSAVARGPLTQIDATLER